MNNETDLKMERTIGLSVRSGTATVASIVGVRESDVSGKQIF